MDPLTQNTAPLTLLGDLPENVVGTSFDRPPATIEEALKDAGLNWTVELDPMYRRKNDAEDATVPAGRLRIVRSDDKRTLGYVSYRYRPLANQEALEFALGLDPYREASLEYAYHAEHGREVGFIVRLGDRVSRLFDITREIDTYAVVRTRHDGRGALTVELHTVGTRRAPDGSSDVVTVERSTCRILHLRNLRSDLAAAPTMLGLRGGLPDNSIAASGRCARADDIESQFWIIVHKSILGL